MEREDDLLCIYYSMSYLKYYFFPSYCNGGKLIRGFSPGTPVFPSPQKPAFTKFQFGQESGRRRTTMWMCYLQIVCIIIIIKLLEEWLERWTYNIIHPFKFFLFPRRVSAFSRGVIFTRVRLSLALLYLRENEGLLVVYF